MQAVQKQQKLPRDKKLSADKYHLLKSDERKRNMKSKFGLIRVLAVVFALVLSISLVSCVKDEDLDSVKTDAGKTQENVNQLQTGVKELQDKLSALTNDVKALTDTAATKSALEDALKKLTAIEESIAGYPGEFEKIQGKLTEVEETLNSVKDLANNAATKEALETATNDIAKVKEDVANAKTDITSLQTAKTNLEKEIADLDKELYGEDGNGGKFGEISTKIGNLNNEIAKCATKADLKALTDRVAALETWKNSFTDKKYLNDYIDFTAKLKDNSYQYSAKNFWDTANAVAEGPYDDEEIKEFNKKIDTIALFLARAVTEEDAKWCFDQLAAAKEALRTLDQTLLEKLDNFEVIANNQATKDAYAKIVDAYNRLYEKDPATAATMTRYQLITEAYMNFFGADGTAGAVGAGAAIITATAGLRNSTIVLGVSDPDVATALTNYQNFFNAYFSNNDWNDLYGVVDENGNAVKADPEAVAASLANGKEIKGYAKRIELLTAAKTYADAQLLTEKFNWNAYGDATNERPLYTNTANKALLDKVNTWAADGAYKSNDDFGTYTGCQNDIELENINAIIGAERYADLKDSVDYVAKMLKVYEETIFGELTGVKAGIVDPVTGLLLPDVVLNSENNTTMTGLKNNIASMDAAIDAIEAAYDNLTSDNKTAMVDAKMRANVAAYLDAYNNVTNKINAIKAQFYTNGAADTTKMSFREYNKIAQFRTDIDAICANLKTTLNTAGVATVTVTAPEAVDVELKEDGTEIVKEGCVLYELNKAYAEYSKDAYAAWKKAKELLDKIGDIENLKLDMGHAVNDTFEAVSDAVNYYQLLFDDQIMLMAEDGTIEENVNLNQIKVKLEQYLIKYDAMATTATTGAEDLAAAINAAITAIKNLDASKMDNYKQISEAQTLMNNWFSNFCSAPAGETDAEKAASLRKMIREDLVNVPTYGVEGAVYKFVDADLYDTLVAQYATAVGTKAKWDAAMANWNTAMTAAQTTKLHTGDLHQAALKAWDAVKALYATELSDTYKGYAAEYDSYNTYKTTYYDVYLSNCANAKAEADAIKILIMALPSINDLTDVTSVTAADLENKLNAIDNRLTQFKVDYCDGDCFFWLHEGDENNLSGTNNTEEDAQDYILVLEKVRALYTYLTETAGKDATLVETNRKSLVTALGKINATANATEGTHDLLIRNVKSQMNAYTKAVNPDYVVG